MNKRTPCTRGVLGNPIGHEQEESLGIQRDREQKTFFVLRRGGEGYIIYEGIPEDRRGLMCTHLI